MELQCPRCKVPTVLPFPLTILQGIGCTLVGVPTDGSGLDPEALAAMLAAWDDRKAPKPRVLYTIPTGSNPTGVTLPLSRRHRLLEVAREHDLAIIEGEGGSCSVNAFACTRCRSDDPYYFLSFAAERIPSLLSLDTDGRVVRCDSLSKVRIADTCNSDNPVRPPSVIDSILRNTHWICYGP